LATKSDYTYDLIGGDTEICSVRIRLELVQMFLRIPVRVHQKDACVNPKNGNKFNIYWLFLWNYYQIYLEKGLSHLQVCILHFCFLVDISESVEHGYLALTTKLTLSNVSMNFT